MSSPTVPSAVRQVPAYVRSCFRPSAQEKPPQRNAIWRSASLRSVTGDAGASAVFIAISRESAAFLMVYSTASRTPPILSTPVQVPGVTS